MAMTTEIENMPPDSTSTEITRLNACRHGVLSRYTLLPWEDAAQYEDVLNSLISEHVPSGPTELHLVEELAGIFWRKRRLRMAETSAHRRGLDRALCDYRDTAKVAIAHRHTSSSSEAARTAVRTTPADTEAQLADIAADQALTLRAMAVLGKNRDDSYEAALLELREDTQEWWAETLQESSAENDPDEELFTTDAASLRRFIEGHVLIFFKARREELSNRDLIREQALGETFEPALMERLARYEVHLDRKLERMLAMLFRLKEVRQDTARKPA
jgi:hypothetical protein